MLCVFCGAAGLTQVPAAHLLGITRVAHSGTAVLTSGWQQSDLVRTHRHHAAEPSIVVANVVLARCMARQSTGARVGGVTYAESRRTVSRMNLQACDAPDAHAISIMSPTFADMVYNLAAENL